MSEQPLVTGAGLNSFRKVFSGGTIYALAEIIDNSIQWKRPDKECHVKVILVEHKDTVRGSYRLSEVLIVDNGLGMSEEAITTCLIFGGGCNHETEEEGKLGKFGLGLPYSSCSVAPEYHVYSWQKESPYRHTFRNHDKYKGNDPVFSESVDEDDALPDDLLRLYPGLKSQESGTIIQWLRCDNLKIAQAKTLIKHINNGLGRIYRHFISKGVDIEFLVYRKDNNNQFIPEKSLSSSIKVLDPLFLMENNVLPSGFSNKATNEPWEKIGPAGEKVITFKEKLPEGDKEHKFTIRCSIAKHEIQFPPGGKDGGKVEPGKSFYKNCIGISLVRAKREIKLAKFDFPMNWTETTQRWWGLEVQFEPISDDLLNVNANKLDANAFRYMSSDDFEELESYGAVGNRERLQAELSKVILKAAKDMHKEITQRSKGTRSKKKKCPKCNKIEFVNGKCGSCGHEVSTCDIHKVDFVNGKCPLCSTTPDIPLCLIHKIPKEDGICPKCGEKKISKLSDTEKRRLIKLIKEDYPEIADKEDLIEMALKYFVQSNQRHFIVFADLKNASIFIQYDEFNKSPEDKGGDFTIIELNTQHAFFEEFIQPLIDLEEDVGLTSLWLFLASWIESEKKDYSNAKVLSRFRERFGFSLNEVIENWNS